MDRKKTCFVIMPYGTREVDGKMFDFDAVYETLIKRTVEELHFNCVRSDKIEESGSIQKKMFEQVYNADVAIVDITSLNANVFYEMGIRHALVPCVTVLIRRKGTHIPFNIQDLKVLEYGDLSLPSDLEGAKQSITNFIINGEANNATDSVVHDVLSIKIQEEPTLIRETTVVEYAVTGSNARLALVTGDIRDVKFADVWVNSENTNMQMARHYDRSISSIIRYLGARREHGQVVEDTIANELAECMRGRTSVDGGEVLVTGAGGLAKSNNVRRVFHAASVVGQVGEGYTPISKIGRCVSNALALMDTPKYRTAKLSSILFPLMGTGVGRGEREEKADELLTAAATYLRVHPSTKVAKVYFLVWSEEELETCKRILRDMPGVTRVNDATT